MTNGNIVDKTVNIFLISYDNSNFPIIEWLRLIHLLSIHRHNLKNNCIYK